MASYGDETGFEAWLDANGHVLPVDAPSPAALLERGAAYIDASYGPRFTGEPVGGIDQVLAWPRTGASAYGSALAETLVPARVVTASYMAAWQEASAPGSLSPGAVSMAGQVKREKIDGAVEVEYSGGSDGMSAADASRVIIPAIEGLLAPLLASTVVEPMVMVV